jgi:hypothetical protein
MSADLLAAGGAPATPSSDGPPKGARGVGPVLGLGLDYVGTLTEEAAADLFRLAGLLRYVLQRQGVSVADAKRRAKWDHLGSLLAITEARRPTLETLHRFGESLGVPADAVRDIAAACSHAIASERNVPR